MGQISGTLFVVVFEAIQSMTGSVSIPMLILVALTAVEVPFTFKMKESKVLR